jgi:hypothetical protein
MRHFRAPGDPLPEKPPIFPLFRGANAPPEPKPGRKPRPPVYVFGRWPIEGI